jgi:DNA repair exonuclease SbcCD nuclease subunit
MIIAIGDVHGKFDQLISKMETILEGNTGVNFVQLGDFGLGFEQPFRDWNTLDPINELLKQSDSMMYVIRGNHDNPSFWHLGRGFDFSNIVFQPDDSIMLIEDKMCYFAGGAISIDRTRRRQGVDYWGAETYVPNIYGYDDYPSEEKVDILFTHDVYHPCSPYSVHNSESVKYFAESDKYLIEDITESQVSMKILYDGILRTNPNFVWYHGHYHESHVTNNNEQITHSLSELEFKEVR